MHRILILEVRVLPYSPCTLLVYVMDGAARQPHRTPPQMRVRYGETLIGTGQAGNPMAARAMKSAVILAKLILVGWQADGQSILDNLYRYQQRRLHQLFGQLRPTDYTISIHCLPQHNCFVPSLGLKPPPGGLQSHATFQASSGAAVLLSALQLPSLPNFTDAASINTVLIVSRKAAIAT
jgi:hypothetical protein